MADTAVVAPDTTSVGALAQDPEFTQMPVDRKIAEISKRIPKDHAFASLSGAARQAVIQRLLGGAASVPSSSPDAMAQAIAQQQPLEPRGAQAAQAELSRPPGAEDYTRAITQGLTRAVDEGALGIPRLGAAALQPAVESVMNTLGYEPGSLPGQVNNLLTKPLETLQAGQQGFAPIEGGPGFVQDLIRQAGGALIGGRLASGISQLIGTTPMPPPSVTDAIVQGVGGATGNRVGEAVAGPWGSVIGELVGALGVQGAKDAVMALRAHGIQASGTREIGNILNDIPSQVLTDHLAETDALNRLVPGLQLTPFQATQSPHLMAVQQLAAKQHPELARRLEIWQERNQQLLQQGIEARLGSQAAVEPAATQAVETLRQPIRAAEQQAAATEQQGAQQVGTATAGVTQAEQQAELTRAQQGLLADQGQQLRTGLERTAASNVPAQPLSLADQRERVGLAYRNYYENRFRQFKANATAEAAQIDPQGLVQGDPAAVTQILQDVATDATGRGLPVPNAVRRLQGIVATTAPDAGGAGTLSMQNLRDMRTTILEEMRSTPYRSREYGELKSLHDEVVSIQNQAAAASGDPDIITRNRAFNANYALGMREFTRGPGEQVLRLRPGATPPQPGQEGDYVLMPLQLLEKTWAPEPIAGTNRGTAALQGFRNLVPMLRKNPDGLDALKTFAAQDFYEKVMRKGEFDVQAANEWLLDNRDKLNAVPELKQAFTGIRQQLDRVREVEANSAKLGDDLLRQQQQVRQAGEGLKTVQATAQARGQQAKEAVDAAITDWRTAFGANREAEFAQGLSTLQDAFGANPQDILARVANLPPAQRRFALGQLTEPIKNDPAAMEGMRRLLWDTFWQKEAAKAGGGGLSEATTLAQDFPLADPAKVMQFLRENEAWFRRYSPQHYDEMTTLARGMQINSLSRAAGDSSVPAALRDVPPMYRMFIRSGFDVGAAGVGYLLSGLPGVIAGAGTSELLGRWVNQLTDRHRLEFLRQAMFDRSIPQLLESMRQPTNPTYTRALAYHTLGRLGLLGSEAASAAQGEEPR